MNETIRVFLEILAAAVHGRRAEISREIPTNEWQMLFHIAGIHNVLPLFYEAVYGHPSLADANLRQAVRQQVILQALRTGEFLELNDRLLSAGVEPLVVKGIVCRNLYPQPDHRPSSDEDVLIPAGQFERCHGVLTEFDRVIGLHRLKAIHLNDSKNPFASHKDRHECIGKGSLGLDTFRNIVNHPQLKDKPMILETPNLLPNYANEIALLRSMEQL